MPVNNDALTEWNELMWISVLASQPAGYWIDTNAQYLKVGVFDNEWRWEERADFAVDGKTIVSDYGVADGPGKIYPGDMFGQVGIAAVGNESDLMQGPDTLVLNVYGEWVAPLFPLAEPSIVASATATLVRKFNLDPVTGYITQSPGQIGYNIATDTKGHHKLAVGIVTANMQFLPATANRNVVQLEVAAVVGMDGEVNIGFSAGPVSISFSNDEYVVRLQNLVAELGAVKGASNPI